MIRRQRLPWSLVVCHACQQRFLGGIPVPLIILLSVLLRRDGASATPTATVTAPGPPLVQEHYFQATVDHFNFRPTTEPTFPLRYLVNDQFWQRNGSGPCFFYAGNEANIWQFVNNSGFLFEAAQELHALVVFAEHRYYGTSKPFGSAYALGAPYNISFLTVEQAMADFNTLTIHIREKWDMSPQAAFIAFGGSYGANLALWLRLKNPNLWAGAIASSATPLKHILRETNGFAEIETEAYANVSARCPDLVRSGWRELYTAASTKSGRTMAASMLGLCHPLPDPNAADDVHGWISSALETMVQYGYPYPTSFYNPVPAYPFKVACEGMLSAETGLEALRAAIDVYYNFTGQAGVCYDFGGLVIPEAAKHWRRKGQHDRLSHQRIRHGDRNNIRDDEEDTEKAWGYQTCTEVYQPMPTDGITDFEVPFTPDQIAYYADCWTRFGVQPRPNWEEMHFMGAHIAAGSNIFLTSGQLDPWRAAGIQSLPPKKGSESESIVVRIIENGAHHLDLRASNEMDPPSVVAVREEQKACIRRWILEWEEDLCQGIESEGYNPGAAAGLVSEYQ
jgi:pimeloyl-ACP methyl ester carboxylesterase